MEINVTGTNCDVGQGLDTHARTELTKITDTHHKHFSFTGIKVFFKKNKHRNYFNVEIVASITGGMKHIVANSKDSDPYIAFKTCKDILQKILKKYKDKKSDYDNESLKSIDAKYSIINDAEADEDEFIDEYETDNDPAQQNLPPIVVEYDQKIYHFSVEDAVMHMEINGLPALLFMNTMNNKVNMVYHRHDGTIGWTAPSY